MKVDYYFDKEYSFSQKDGFNVAFGISDAEENIFDLDPSYGYLDVINFAERQKFVKPKFSKCKDADFPAEDGNDKFFPIARQSMLESVATYWTKLNCLDESVQISQNINIEKPLGKYLRIGFFNCHELNKDGS